MNDRFKRIFFNILFCLFGIALCFYFKIDSYAKPKLSYVVSLYGTDYYPKYRVMQVTDYNQAQSYRYCFYTEVYDNKRWFYIVCNSSYNPICYVTNINFDGSSSSYADPLSSSVLSTNYGQIKLLPSNNHLNMSTFQELQYTFSVQDGYVFDNLNDAANYVNYGVTPPLDYNSELNLDTLRVSSWNFGNLLGPHYDWRYNIETTWTDSDIANVKLRIKGTRKTDDFMETESPFNVKIHGYDYTNQNGDIVQIIATPYDSNGAYGNSLYSTFEYTNLNPWTKIWRKLFKTPDYDNTIEIPYNDPSGNDNVITVPVDGVTNNYTYNIKYNPQTEEITNQYLVDNYYTLVVDYPEDLSDNETIINETQNYLNEYYTTNNYYQTTKDVDVDFDFHFGDISSNDAQEFKTQFDGFFDGLGNFIGKLAKLIVGLAPWLSPAVAVWIVAGFGFLVALLVLLLVIKLVSFVRSLLPF